MAQDENSSFLAANEWLVFVSSRGQRSVPEHVAASNHVERQQRLGIVGELGWKKGFRGVAEQERVDGRV